MEKPIQTRSEINGIAYFDTILEALVAAANHDTSIWKISYDGVDGGRIRLIRTKDNGWKQENIDYDR
jgi:hypothetical protein